MALHILPPQEDFGSRLGTIVGSGLGQGLNSLVQGKLSDINRQRGMQQLQRIGLSPEQSELLHHIKEINPQMYGEYLGRVLENMPGMQQQPMYEPETYMQEQVTEPSGEKVSIQKEIMKPSSDTSLFENKEAKKRAHEEQKMINKEVYPVIKDIQHKAKGAKENDLRLKRMEKLIETGKLNAPAFASALKTLKHGIFGIGIDLTSLLSQESEEFEKLSNDFIKNAKDVFGSRITDQDLKSFLATVPNLSQSDSGKRAVIHNLQLLNKGAELREQAARKLLQKYNNKPPLDFESRVEDLIKPELDKISEKFEKGVGKSSKQYKYFNPEE
jgi:hypothetical protein